MKVAAYCRIATANQVDADCFTIQAQQDVLFQYAHQKNFEITKVYSDIGYKGHDLMRPGFCEMMKDAQQGLFDAVLVKNLDRLFRCSPFTYPQFPVPVICVDLQNIKKKPQNNRGDR